MWAQALTEVNTISCYSIEPLYTDYLVMVLTYIEIVGFKVIFRITRISFWKRKLKLVKILIISGKWDFVLVIELVCGLYQIHWRARLCWDGSILCSRSSRRSCTRTIGPRVILLLQVEFHALTSSSELAILVRSPSIQATIFSDSSWVAFATTDLNNHILEICHLYW